jgi:hypothetical protein
VRRHSSSHPPIGNRDVVGGKDAQRPGKIVPKSAGRSINVEMPDSSIHLSSQSSPTTGFDTPIEADVRTRPNCRRIAYAMCWSDKKETNLADISCSPHRSPTAPRMEGEWTDKMIRPATRRRSCTTKLCRILLRDLVYYFTF